MKKYLQWITSLLILSFVIPQLGLAQSVRRQSVGSYGSNGLTRSAVIGQTVGQPFATGVYSDNGITLTPGFQQPVMYKKTQAVKELELMDLDTYPNPARDNFTIKSKELLENVVVRVNNIDGRLIFEEMLSGLYIYVVDCSDWQTGLYFITVNAQNARKFYSKKIIITK